LYIEHIEGQNIGPRAEFSYDLSRGLIGIFGDNGAGKTTLVNSIYSCLTNDFTRLNRKKEGAILDTSDEDEDAFISVTAVHGDARFTLTRYLRPSKSELRVEGQKKPIRKATAIQQELESVLGIRRQLIDNYVFVNQWQMFDFLSQTITDRAKAFQYLCNTVKAEEIWKLTGDMLPDIEDLCGHDVEDNRDQLRREIADRRKRINSNDDELAVLHETVLLGPQKERYIQKIVDDYNKAKIVRENLESGQQKLTQAEADMATKEGLIQNAQRLWDEASGLVASLVEEADAAKLAMSQAKQAKAQGIRLQRLTTELNGLVVPVEPKKVSGVTEQSVNKLRDEIATRRSEYAEAKKVTKAFEEEGVIECPTCGTLVEDLHDHLENQREKAISLGPEIEKLKEKLKRFEGYAKAMSDYRVSQEKYDTAIKRINEEIAATEQLEFPEGDMKDWQEAVATYEAAVKTQDDARKLCEKRKRDLSVVKGALKAHEAFVVKMKKILGELKVTKDDYVQAQKKLAGHNTAKDMAGNLKASSEALREVVESFHEDLKRKDRLIAQGQAARDFHTRLTRIRQVCHREYWPKMVAESYLEDLQHDMNAWLDQFGSPFCVRAGDDLTFQFRKPGKPWREAELLSGGEKVVLALALRRAINLIFAAEIGMMSLDEPTAGLSAHNVGCLREALVTLATDSKNRGNQVIIITHEDSLRPVFDQVIEVVA